MSALVSAYQLDKSPTEEVFRNTLITVPAGSNQIVLVVACISGTAGTPSLVGTPTFDGNNMTAINFTNFGPGNLWATFAYYYKAPATGTKQFHVEWTTPGPGNVGRIELCIYIIDGVDQATTVRAITAGTAATLSAISCTIGDLLVDLCASTVDTIPSGEGTGQTKYLADDIAPAYGNVASSTKQAASASETMSWSTGFGGTIRHIGIPVIPVSAAASAGAGFFGLM